MFEPYNDVIEDLSRDMAPQLRYQRLLLAVGRDIPADAIALLKLQDNVLKPLAVQGMRPEILGRRFALQQHPRLAEIMNKQVPVRFAHDSKLPDPYDGLIGLHTGRLPVHDCMGIPLYLENTPWGVITLDSLKPGCFDMISVDKQMAAASVARAVVTAANRSALLEQQLNRGQDVTAELNRELAARPLIGHSDAMQQLRQHLEAVATTPLSVLLQGETGVGKEIVSRHLHFLSDRLKRPFVQINCAALPETLAESELFGHTEGAYTGAGKQRRGRFELADGGTLFLDEVGELPMSIQVKLLRALQEGELQRVGSDEPVKVDVRIIAATNRDLGEEVRNGRFRADLYHRLSVYPITIPPLRERGNDVLELAEYFLERDQHRLNIQKLVLSDTARQGLKHYSWPGNIRELEHVLSRAALRSSRNQNRRGIVKIDLGDLDIDKIYSKHSEAATQQMATTVGKASGETKLTDAINDFKSKMIQQRLLEHQNNVAAAARSLGLDRSNLLRLMRRLGIR